MAESFDDSPATPRTLEESAEMPDCLESTESLPSQAVLTDVTLAPEHEKKELEETISRLEGEIMELRSHLRHLDGKRREALNKLLDLKGSIRVFCRIRPFLEFEKRSKPAQITPESEKVSIQSVGKKKDYIFDRVFSYEASQEDVFVEVQPILRSALDGHNVCIFAYGQTGTGKTFTMEGTPDCPGIVPRAISALFYQASLDNSVSFKFSLSMVEVYMGNLKDLLAHKLPTRMMESSCNSRSVLHMQTDSNGSVEIDGLTEIPVTDLTQANKSYLMGRKARSTSWTNVNEASSRSHCLTRLTITRNEGSKEVLSKLWMVDLGGSERLLKTRATGQTLDEGRAINLSLSALGDVICALRRKRNHVPYRNSKFTQILKDSLGVDSKALMVIHISPKDDDVNETICSLNFGLRARGVECLKEVSQELKRMKIKRIAELNQEMKDAEQDCQNVRDHVQRVECMLSEKKRIFSNTCARDDQGGSPRSPLTIAKDLFDSPQVERATQRCSSECLPRFMSSTACSRQRQLADKESKTTKMHRSVMTYLYETDFRSSGSRIHFHSVFSFKSSMRSGLSLRSDSRTVPAGESSFVCRDMSVHSSSKIPKTPNIKRLSASPLASQARQLCDPNARKRMPDKLNSCDLSGRRSKETRLIHSSLPNSNLILHARDTISAVSQC